MKGIEPIDDSNKRTPCLWQIVDSEPRQINLGMPGNASVYSGHSAGNDLYLAGSYETVENNGVRNTACLWKNGQKTDLSGYGGHNAEALAVHIVLPE